jgi:putative Mg2+ transporter-C (MgtC) family protein
MLVPTEDLLKILEAFIAGALLGLEREARSKPAGLRTMILITVGSALFSILSTSLGNDSPDRIASNIVTGVGFVGAGVIFKQGINLQGITTAATIWAAAAIGMAIGFGSYWMAFGTLLVVLVTLTLLPYLEERLDSSHLKQMYSITFDVNKYSLQELEKAFADMKINFLGNKLIKKENEITVTYSVNSLNANLQELNNFLLTNPTIKGFEA